MANLITRDNPDPWFDPESTLFVSAGEARKHFAKVIDSAKDGERVIVTKHGRPAAAVVSVRDYRIIQMIESAGLSNKLLEMAKQHEVKKREMPVLSK